MAMITRPRSMPRSMMRFSIGGPLCRQFLNEQLPTWSGVKRKKTLTFRLGGRSGPDLARPVHNSPSRRQEKLWSGKVLGAWVPEFR